MYQSPISIYETAIQTIMEQRENAIFAKVQDAFDVQVDKKELIRALKYDRNQYEVGYRDGKADAAPKWIPVSERLPKYNTFVIVFAEGIVGEAVLDDADYWYWAGTDEYASEINVTHWMPLPEAPKCELAEIVENCEDCGFCDKT